VPAVTSPRVLVVGSANVDYTVAVARLPAPGETVSEGVLLVNHGGKGANQAVAARRLGADVRLIACVGADAGGRAIQAALAGEGIDAARVHAKDDVATGTALIVVDATGRNQIAVAPGANRALRIEQLRAHRDAFGWAQVVLCQLETPLDIVAAALEEARRCGAVTILNPAPVPTAPLGVWPLVDYLTPNRGEAERLSGVRGTDAEGVVTGAGRLRAKGVGTVVVTLGEDGALACDSQGTMNVPGFSVSAVDTTAAGDAFNAALAVALAEGHTLAEAVRFANAAGALACTRRGAQVSLPTRTDVERLLRDGSASSGG
jgi:ribokinase